VRAMFKKDGGDKERIDVNELVEGILALAEREIQRGGISVRTVLPSELPRVLADRTQLQQVLLNLTRNALDALGPITDREKLLVIEAAVQDPDNVWLTVRDSGTGIDGENLDRIFDPFFTTKSNGMGMGLSICRSIVEAHGGRLWASRGDPYGSAFHVVLPTTQA
jgi:signal transduction histidine kinase